MTTKPSTKKQSQTGKKAVKKSKKSAKRTWLTQPKSEIKFINPERTKAVPPGEITTSNWELLKKEIVSKPSSEGAPKKKHKPKLNDKIEDARKPRVRKRKAENQPDQKEGKRSRSMTDQKSSYAEKAGKKTEVWFDDVDPALLEDVALNDGERKESKPEAAGGLAEVTSKKPSDGMMKSQSTLIKPGSFEGLTGTLAIDCEMVGAGKNDMLARVSIVNVYGHCIYDTFVKPKEKVTDYRTFVSGVRPKDLVNAPEFEEVQKKVYALVDKRILVGHALNHDLKVLYLSHPRKLIRDTSRYAEFKKMFKGQTPSLKKLTEKLLGVRIQSGEHNSIEDARATMRLYTMYKAQWEKQIKARKKKKGAKTS